MKVVNIIHRTTSLDDGLEFVYCMLPKSHDGDMTPWRKQYVMRHSIMIEGIRYVDDQYVSNWVQYK